MDSYEKALVIILATVLAILLTTLTVAVIKIIQILNSIKLITAKADQLADKAGNISEILQKSASAAVAGKILLGISQAVMKLSSRSKKG